MYQQTHLSDHSPVGSPGPLPYAIANWTDDQVADLDAAGLDPQFGLSGMSFWPVYVTGPAFDPRSQVVVPPTACDTVDTTARRWKATATVRAMTADELAAVPPRTATFTQVSNALDALGLTAPTATAWDKLKPLMRAYFGSHYADPIPETGPKVAKLVSLIAAAQTSGTALTVAALFDKAVTE